MSDPNDNPARSRRRRQRRSYALLILAAGMLAFGLAAGALYYVLRPTTLRIAVGPAGSEDQKLVQLMAQTFARENSAVRLSLVTTEGTADSLALFPGGKADLAVARGDLNLPENAESVAILRKNVVVLWAPSGLPAKGSKKQPTPKIKTLDELAGHRVGVIGRTQANVTLLRVILKESGINPDKVTISQFGTNQINEMAREQPTASQIEKPDTDKDAALPAHAGAAAYIDGNERTFLEKYTDYIWFAVLIVSGLGSAGAWLKHYWHKDEREQYIAHRDQLLELISRARKAETPEELADMQSAADGMLRETLDCYDDGTVEESDLSVIAMTLEQFHHAVADRRAVLQTGAADKPRMRAS